MVLNGLTNKMKKYASEDVNKKNIILGNLKKILNVIN